MSDEIGNNNNIQNGDKKDDNPIQLGINSQDLSDTDLLKIIALSQGRSLITLKYELNELIFNLGQALVQNIILSDESD